MSLCAALQALILRPYGFHNSCPVPQNIILCGFYCLCFCFTLCYTFTGSRAIVFSSKADSSLSDGNTASPFVSFAIICSTIVVLPSPGSPCTMVSSVIQNYLHFLLKESGDFGRITLVFDLDFLPSLRL